MSVPSLGRHKSFASFAAHLAEAAPSLVADEHLLGDSGPLGSRLAVGSLQIPNRWAIHPMEGWDGTTDGRPTAWTLRRWRKFGESGAGLVWGGEAYAVDPAGRANPNQLALFDAGRTREDLARLLAELRAGRGDAGLDPEGAVVGLQLTHSGRHSRPEGAKAPLLAAHVPWLDRHTGVANEAHLLSDEELAALVPRYVEVARAAQEVGFQFVDVKACHGYLMHELLAARGREGRYGGSYEGRTRLLLEVIDAIAAACPGLAIGSRICVGDLIPHAAAAGEPGAPIEVGRPLEHGWGVDLDEPTRMDPTEPLRLVGDLLTRGVRLINVTVGTPYTCPHVQRPAAYPPFDGYGPPEDPLTSLERQVALTRELKEAHPDAVVVATGYSYLQEWAPHVAQAELARGGADLVGLGRMVLSYPRLPLDTLQGSALDRKRICRTFSDCTNGPRSGLRSGCFPLDPAEAGSEDAVALRAKKAQARARAGRKP